MITYFFFFFNLHITKMYKNPKSKTKQNTQQPNEIVPGVRYG